MSFEIDTSECSDENVFHIGLCMTGAVSAGAYTAGVMDYLLEALNEWENRRGEVGVPAHRVVIPVIGGASAGGMTAIMTAAMLSQAIVPVDKPGDDLLADHPENKFYHTWVDLSGKDMISKMLDTDDIKSGKVESMLNSNFIDPIARHAINTDHQYSKPLPGFIKPGLKVFATLTNLQGFDYTVNFGSDYPGSGIYHMEVHNDYACFELSENQSTEASKGWIPLNFNTGLNVDLAREAAQATGAFPVGFKPRSWARDARYVNNNPWLKDILAAKPLPEGNYSSLYVDGGLVNNEPFEKVRDVLNDICKQPSEDYENYDTFKSTVLMIEPFPTMIPKPLLPKRSLLHIIDITLSAIIRQLRSKPVQLADALRKTCAGQSLIAPSRITDTSDGKKRVTGELAIACGAVAGFSGFISKEFRIHDYFLGRYNCKIFLRDYFTIPQSALDKNEIFKNGYAAADRERFKSTKSNSYQIIPVFADTTDYTFPDIIFNSGSNWPTVETKDIYKYRDELKIRIQALLLNVFTLNTLSKFLIWAGAKIVMNRILARAVMRKVITDLKTWNLLT